MANFTLNLNEEMYKTQKIVRWSIKVSYTSNLFSYSMPDMSHIFSGGNYVFAKRYFRQ